MNKSEIRKQILEIRKKNISNNLVINLKYIKEILRKHKALSKIIGGYYPYNYEVNPIEILGKFEKQNYQISLPKIKKIFKWIFFDGQLMILFQ